MTTRPSFLDTDPVALQFGTSGLRGLVRDMTDLEVYINTQGFLAYLQSTGQTPEPGPVLLGRDLRERDPSGQSSSPRIAAAVAQAIHDFGGSVVNAGTVPTPALAAYALAGGPEGRQPLPAIMVTGSHIPADRNGVKFYRPAGEVLKADESGILQAVQRVRAREYEKNADDSAFGSDGQLKNPPTLPAVNDGARRAYIARYLAPYGASEPLAGQRVVVYEHSSVARDILAEVLLSLGADIVRVGRVDDFVSVDTEDVTADDEYRYRQFVLRYDGDALVSTDGDGDRPLLVDNKARFHRGDRLGLLCAQLLGARFAAVPVSSTDAIEQHLSGVPVTRTRIGSPYVIDAMNKAVAEGHTNVVGWEANGGFLTATPFMLDAQPMAPLPTRDALLPLITVLVASVRADTPLSQMFAALPQRATRAGLLDDFAPEKGRALLSRFRPADPDVLEIRFSKSGPSTRRRDHDWQAVDSADVQEVRHAVERYFAGLGGGDLRAIDLVDGVRLTFASGDIVHLRPSGNAPQFRVYAVADSQARADELVALTTDADEGILVRMERDIGR